MDVRTRAQRLAPSEETHFLGTLCKRGHDAGGGRTWRHKGTRRCDDCNRERARLWKETNPERARANTARRDQARTNAERRVVWPFAHHVGSVRKRAKEDGLPYSITADDAKAIWQEQGGRCYWLGVPLSFTVGRDRDPMRPSLDRLEPSLGYVPGNVVWATNFANRARGDLPADEFRALLQSLKLSR